MKTTKALINRLAHHDVESWKAQHRQEENKHVYEMANLYSLLFSIPYSEAREMCKYHRLAAWQHDVAEVFDDEGLPELADKYWRVVEDTLKEHYRLLMKVREEYDQLHMDFETDTERDEHADKIAYQQMMSWRVHHFRDYEAFKKHYGTNYSLQLGVGVEEAQRMAGYVVESLKTHDYAESSEDSGERVSAEKYWKRVEEGLRLFYTELLAALK